MDWGNLTIAGGLCSDRIDSMQDNGAEKRLISFI